MDVQCQRLTFMEEDQQQLSIGAPGGGHGYVLHALDEKASHTGAAGQPKFLNRAQIQLSLERSLKGPLKAKGM